MNISEHKANSYNTDDYNKSMYYPAGCCSCSCSSCCSCSCAASVEEDGK